MEDGGSVHVYGDTIIEVVSRLMRWLGRRGEERAILYGPGDSMSRRVTVLRSRDWDVLSVRRGGRTSGHRS